MKTLKVGDLVKVKGINHPIHAKIIDILPDGDPIIQFENISVDQDSCVPMGVSSPQVEPEFYFNVM